MTGEKGEEKKRHKEGVKKKKVLEFGADMWGDPKHFQPGGCRQDGGQGLEANEKGKKRGGETRWYLMKTLKKRGGGGGWISAGGSKGE